MGMQENPKQEESNMDNIYNYKQNIRNLQAENEDSTNFKPNNFENNYSYQDEHGYYQTGKLGGEINNNYHSTFNQQKFGQNVNQENQNVDVPIEDNYQDQYNNYENYDDENQNLENQNYENQDFDNNNNYQVENEGGYENQNFQNYDDQYNPDIYHQAQGNDIHNNDGDNNFNQDYEQPQDNEYQEQDYQDNNNYYVDENQVNNDNQDLQNS